MARYLRHPDDDEGPQPGPLAATIAPVIPAPSPPGDEPWADRLPATPPRPALPAGPPQASPPTSGDPGVPAATPTGRVTVPAADELHWFG